MTIILIFLGFGCILLAGTVFATLAMLQKVDRELAAARFAREKVEHNEKAKMAAKLLEAADAREIKQAESQPPPAKTRAAMVYAFPFGHSKGGGLGDYSDDAAWGLEEEDCEVLEAGMGWTFTTKDGRKITTPISATMIVWEAPAKKWYEGSTAGVREGEKPTKTQAAELERAALEAEEHERDATFPPLPPPPQRPQVYTCQDPTCRSTFTKELEAVICFERHREDNKPTYEGGDCRACGYPLALHGSSDREGFCRFELPSGTTWYEKQAQRR